ncbi:MAG: hypothetical protein AB8C95_01375 [Phycisphaeraceae bacterium]
MSRTLHVIDQPGEAAEAAVLRLSIDAVKQDEQNSTNQHAWLLFGGQVTRDAARALGLRDEQFRLHPEPTGLHQLLPAALAQPKQLMAQAHRVVCWTEGATQIASLLDCAHVARQIHNATLCPFAKRVITQAHDSSDHSAQIDRESRRKQWGVKEGATVIALLGDRFDQINASAAMMTIASAYEALCATQPERADVHLLCHPLAHGRADAAELSRLLGIDHLLIQDEAIATPWSVLRACDIALALLPDEVGLSMLWAEAMGVPMITPRDVRVPMLETLKQVIPARSTKPRDLADALTRWVTNQSQLAANSSPG